MANFLGKFVKKQEPKKQETSYVLVDPRHLHINYRYFALFPTINAAVESPSNTLLGLLDTISLPTKPFMQYIFELQDCPDKMIKNPLYRTVQVIPFNNKKIFVFPNVNSMKNPVIVYNGETFIYPSVPEHKVLGPELQQILTEAVKPFTR